MRPADRTTEPIRVYRGDKNMVERMALERKAATGRRVYPADVIHELLAKEREKERGNGMVQ